MKSMIAKEYVIAFDHYIPTAHMEKSLLVLNKDKTYQLMPSDVHPSGNQAATIPAITLATSEYHRLSIGKYRVGERRKEQSDDATSPLTMKSSPATIGFIPLSVL